MPGNRLFAAHAQADPAEEEPIPRVGLGAGTGLRAGQKPKATPTRPPVDPLTVEPAKPPLT
jgi:hypothetical protein